MGDSSDRMNFSEVISQILEEAPASRKGLADNHNNLLQVADYCESKYIEVSSAQKKRAPKTGGAVDVYQLFEANAQSKTLCELEPLLQARQNTSLPT